MDDSIKTVTGWITTLGKILKCELSLNEEDGCSFQIGENTVINIIVSKDFPQIHLYSTLLPFPENNYEAAELMMTRALELNCFQALTRGGAIASPPGGGSLIFCYNIPISGNDEQSFAHIVDAFYETVLNLREVLLEIQEVSNEDEVEKDKKPTMESSTNTKPLNWMKI